jgi:integrase/recombinase XerD
MSSSPNRARVRGHVAKPQSNSGLATIIRDTARLWRKHGLDYDQTEYVIERA